MPVDARDPFPRRTATPQALAPWLVELGRTLPSLARSYGLGSTTLDPRTRERVILAVTEVNGCRYCAWIHGEWHQFLGDGSAHVDEAVLAYARACAEQGRPLDPHPLRDVLPAQALGSLRATVAQIEVSNLVGNTVDGLLARVTRKRPFAPLAAAREAVTVAAALPLAVPLLAAAGAMRVVNRMTPPLSGVDTPPPGEANLLVHLVAQAVPAYLSNALVRRAILDFPFAVSIGLKAGRTAATVRIGRGGVSVANGIASDALLIVEGDVEPLLRLATGSIVRELAGIRIRPNT
jgi:alkylhydroperoxidase family enzyme